MQIAFITDRPELGTPQRPILGDGPEVGRVRWGTTRVTSRPDLKEGWAWSPEADPAVPGNIAYQSESEIIAACRRHLAKPKAGLLVHIHGAGNETPLSFARTARLCELYGGEDLDLMGLVVSWSSGLFSVDDYLAARKRLIAAPQDLARAFATLIEGIHRPDLDQPVFLLAHSLGNHLLGCVARFLLENDIAALQPVFREILLCAADVDNDALSDAAKLGAVERLGNEIHVYSSVHDTLPGLSFLGGFFIPGREGTALGNSGPSPVITSTPKGTAVDIVKWFPADPPPGIAGEPDPRHHYWHTEPAVVADVRAVLRGVGPKQMAWRGKQIFDRTAWIIA